MSRRYIISCGVYYCNEVNCMPYNIIPINVLNECDATYGGLECDNVHGGQSQCLQLFHCLPHHRLTAWTRHLNAAQVYQLTCCMDTI